MNVSCVQGKALGVGPSPGHPAGHWIPECPPYLIHPQDPRLPGSISWKKRSSLCPCSAVALCDRFPVLVTSHTLELNHASKEPGRPVRRGCWSQDQARHAEGWIHRLQMPLRGLVSPHSRPSVSCLSRGCLPRTTDSPFYFRAPDCPICSE